jgi:NAD(P)-dependent dehydrogenase (short-subunit alcohol dehydrogenase family)
MFRPQRPPAFPKASSPSSGIRNRDLDDLIRTAGGGRELMPTFVECTPAQRHPTQSKAAEVTIPHMDDATSLFGHVALVTGGGRRLGRAFAESLASRGAALAVHYGSDVSGAKATAQAAREHGVESETFRADLSDPQAAMDLVRRATDTFGFVDILINSAAIFEPVDAIDCSLESWQAHVSINLTAPFVLSQAFARMRNGQRGSIVNILDWRAQRPGSDHFPYTISKAGLATMTLSLAQGLAPAIRVNGLALGAILPPPGQTERKQGPIQDVPLGRWGEVEEACRALLFLVAGPEYITGQILHVDGGRHLV